MEAGVTSGGRVDAAAARIQQARFAMRTNRWWEARMLLSEARRRSDWTVLGYESLEAYTADVLGQRLPREPSSHPPRVAGEESAGHGDAGDHAGDAAPPPHAYIYQLHVRRRPGVWRRWQGRVVTRDLDGTQRFWPWRFSHERERLVQLLSDDAMRDIQWRHNDGQVEVIEATDPVTTEPRLHHH